MRIITLVFVFSLLFLAKAYSYAGHAISGDASKQISNGIKAELLAALPTFINQTTAKILKEDLNEEKECNRKLVSIDVVTAGQIWVLFGLKDPGCDANKDGFVSGEELKCLNKLWKYYVPK